MLLLPNDNSRSVGIGISANFSFYDMKTSEDIVTVTIEMHGSIESPTSLDCIEYFFRVLKDEYEKSCKNAENQ